MAKLDRKIAKIFAKNSGSDQRAVFGSLAAGAPAFTTDPATAQSLSNWESGWPSAVIGGNSPAMEDMNSFCFVMAYQLAYLMQQGVAEWNAETTYYLGSMVNNAGDLYYSLTDDNLNNAISDTAFWKLYSAEKPGVGKDFWDTDLPAGYVWAAGRTIGSAASGATERANIDTFPLFNIFWNKFTDTTLPIYDSTGILSSRGGSAASDFAANKRMSTPDKRGRVSIGKDNMAGTTSQDRITVAGCGIDGDEIGASGGSQNHVLTIAEMPSHTHTQDAHGHSGTFAVNGNLGSGTWGGGPTGQTSGVGGATATNQNTGGDGAHSSTQPGIVCNYIIKL